MNNPMTESETNRQTALAFIAEIATREPSQLLKFRLNEFNLADLELGMISYVFSGPKKEIPNLESFHSLANTLHDEIKQWVPEPWLHNTVPYRLNGEKTDQIEREEITININRNDSLRCLPVVSHESGFHFLLVEKFESEERTFEFVESAFEHCNQIEPSYLISAPNCQHALLIEKGNQLKLVDKKEESPFEIIHGANYKHLMNQDLRIISARQLNRLEKWVLAEIKGKRELKDEELIMVQYESLDDKSSMTNPRIRECDSLDYLLCSNMVDPQRLFEEFHLKIKYQMTPKTIKKLRLTLENYEQEKMETIFKDYQLKIIYSEDVNKEDVPLKIVTITEFPRSLNTIEKQKEYVLKLFDKLQLPVPAIEYIEEMIPRADVTCERARRENRIHHIIAAAVENLVPERLEGFGCNLCREDPQPPPYREKETFVLKFLGIQGAQRMIQRILEEARNTTIFRIDESDAIGPVIEPLFRCAMMISRSARVALHQPIQDLVSELCVNLPVHLQCFGSISDEYASLRIFEEWDDGCDIGVIGVEGWTMPVVRKFAIEKLQPLLKPTEFSMEVNPELKNKIGQLFVQSLPMKYRGKVVVDVDQFNNKISLLGENALEALEDLKHFSERKTENFIEIQIKTGFPYFNNGIDSFLTSTILDDIQKCLGLEGLRLNRHLKYIEFNGTFAALECFVDFLKVLSDKISAKLYPEANNMTCPICFCVVGIHAKSVLFDCGHPVCLDCLQDAVRANISDLFKMMKCFKEDCKGHLSPTKLMEMLLGNEKRMKSLDNSKLRKLFASTTNTILVGNENKKSCQTEDCPGLWYKDPQPNGWKCCAVCSFEYCGNCLDNIHPNKPCEDMDLLRKTLQQFLSVNEEIAKECPGCHGLIIKVNGCMHMECRCGTHFCFICGMQGEDGAVIQNHITQDHFGMDDIIVDIGVDDFVQPDPLDLWVTDDDEDDDDDDSYDVDSQRQLVFDPVAYDRIAFPRARRY